jgi:hypothetical protein
MKIFRLKNNLIINFSNGTSYRSTDCTDKFFDSLKGKTEQEIKDAVQIDTFSEQEIISRLKESKILEQRGMSIIMPSVSSVTLPMDLVTKILTEEFADGNVQKYINFWKLVSLNPDDRVRANIYWFLKRWNVEITNGGLCVVYRNANIKTRGKINTDFAKWIIEQYYDIKYNKKENPANYFVNSLSFNNFAETYEITEDPEDENLASLYYDIVNNKVDVDTYTDAHSGTTTIKIGEPVRIPREDCDSNQENSCSTGLHVGGKGWLKQNYFGYVGLECLVNPANIVAVPTIDNYGKLRCCEYYPVGIIEYNEDGEIVDRAYSVDYELEVLKDSLYDGVINNEDGNQFIIETNYISREDIYNSYTKQID